MAQTRRAGSDLGSQSPSLGPQILRVVLGICLLAALAYFFARGGNFANTPPARPQLGDATPPADAQRAVCGQPSRDGHPVDIDMLYSADKRAWIEAAADRFSHLCPNIQVKLTALEDLDAIQALLAGTLRPAVWSPSDELSVRLLAHRRSQQAGMPPLAIVQKDSLVESPLVLLIWEDRLRVLSTLLQSEPSSEGLWLRTRCPLIPRSPSLAGMTTPAMVPGSWADWYAALNPSSVSPAGPRAASVVPTPSVQGPSGSELPSWGRVKVGSLMPTRYASGVAALYLLAFDYVVPPALRQAATGTAIDATPNAQDSRSAQQEQWAAVFEEGVAAKKESLQIWLRRCQAGQRIPAMSEQALAESMFNLGPSEFDAVVTSEHATLPLLDRLDSHEDGARKLAVFYPTPTRVLRHPAVLFATDARRRDAAQKWTEFLRGEAMQKLALASGFRPVHPAVAARELHGGQSRFLRLRRFGITPDRTWTEAPLPSGRALHDLMTIWGEATGRY